MKIVDLSHPFRPGLANTPAFPEHDVSIEAVRTVEADGVSTMLFRLSDHVGTHVDAPSHVIAGGATIGAVSLDRFFGPALALDLRRGPDQGIGADELRDAKPSIGTGDIVLLETGWSERIGTRDYTDHHPYLTEEGAEWLVQAGVRAVGIDVSSVDLPHSLRPPGFRHRILRILLDAGIPVIHGLTHLDEIRHRRCTVAAFPIVFEGADAGPARVVALVDSLSI